MTFVNNELEALSRLPKIYHVEESDVPDGHFRVPLPCCGLGCAGHSQTLFSACTFLKVCIRISSSKLSELSCGRYHVTSLSSHSSFSDGSESVRPPGAYAICGTSSQSRSSHKTFHGRFLRYRPSQTKQGQQKPRNLSLHYKKTLCLRSPLRFHFYVVVSA